MDLAVPAVLSAEAATAVKTALRVLHFVGLVLGLGAATLLDLIMLRFLAAGTVSHDHHRIVAFSAKVVAGGLALLWVSGLGFLAHYALFEPAMLGNDKIWAKAAIVGVLTVNGVFIHNVVLPLVERSVGRGLFDGMSGRRRAVVLASGAVSATSWYVPMLIGNVPQLDFVVPAWLILAAYAALLLFAVAAAVGAARLVLPPAALAGPR